MPGPAHRPAPASDEPWRRAVQHVAVRSSGPPLDPAVPVTVHLHRDRPVGQRTLLEHLVHDGVYRSQFETGTSNGGLTAHPGGDRWRWESRLFGGAYDDAPAGQRPTYGSPDHRRRPAGGSVRFGSAHLRLAPTVLPRTTFCYPGSVTEPRDVGTAARMPLVALALADERVGSDVLDDHVAYRGLRVVTVGREIARRLGDGWLDARVLGDAVRAGVWDPQELERLWHCVARFGRPAG